MANNSLPGSSGRGIDLASLFNVATQALAANQASLNQADTENQNHGDNMVQVFSMIAQAVGSKPNASPSEQLGYASQVVAQNANSGSGQAYAQGLAQAAQQFQGQPAVTQNNTMLLIQSLLGGGQPAQPAAPAQPAGGDLLGSLLGGGQAESQGADLLGALLGGGQAPQGQGQEQASQAGGDLLGSLLGGGQAGSQGADLLGALLGGGQAEPAPQSGGQAGGGLDLGDLLNAGMTFMNARQQGKNNLQAGLEALMAAGPLGQKPHRQQSGQLVANAMLQAVASLTGRK